MTIARIFSIFWLAALISCSGSAFALERLSVTRDGATRSYTFDELDQLVGRSELEIPNDYIFKGKTKRYLGYDLATLFERLRLPKDREYLLVCTDGYAIDFDARVLANPAVQAHLAAADADAGDDVWLPYFVGSKETPIAPFYLTWRVRADAPANATLPDMMKLPWPYALTEIREKTSDATAAAAPTHGATATVTAGFDAYQTHCIKCHRVSGVGGTLGPELTTSPAVQYLSDSELLSVIERIDRYYTDSKMPLFEGALPDQETLNIVAYLRHINERARAEDADQ